MSYQVRFTDTTKTPLTVDDQTINSEKSLKFVGKCLKRIIENEIMGVLPLSAFILTIHKFF
jgi:hypothetical protein